MGGWQAAASEKRSANWITGGKQARAKVARFCIRGSESRIGMQCRTLFPRTAVMSVGVWVRLSGSHASRPKDDLARSDPA